MYYDGIVIVCESIRHLYIRTDVNVRTDAIVFIRHFRGE